MPDLEELKSEIYNRMNYAEDSPEKEQYEQENDRLYDIFLTNRSSDSIEKLEELKKKKFIDIKSKSQNNLEFLKLINEKLPYIDTEIKNKQTQLTTLIPPNKPGFIRRGYRFVTGKTNDPELNNYNNSITKLQNEISDLEHIKTDILTLLPIYSENNSSGGKTKKRRNIKRKKSTKKNYYLKSNYRR